MIIQGSNKPIVLNFNISVDSITKFSAVLIDKISSIRLKQWELNDVTISEDKIILPLSEEETMGFKPCKATLKVKLLQDNYIEFGKDVDVDIERWQDNTQLIEG